MSTLDRSELERLATIDRRIVNAAKQVSLLSRLSWSKAVQERFLADWHAGRTRLPEPVYAGPSLSTAILQLETIVAELEGEDPLVQYLRETAASYAEAARLIEGAGTASAAEAARRLYGSPRDSLSGGRLTNFDAARHFLQISRAYEQQEIEGEIDLCLSADVLKAELEGRLGDVFDPGTIAVVIDPAMASKAAAGATRVRLRAGTCFSEYDLEQLLQHEAFVHSLTALNGRDQPHFQCLSLGAPRTTRSQEGLATFSELVTGAIDIKRMERIALRVLAVDRALSGADFVEVFRYFLDNGQPEAESYASTMRVFRGVPVTGGHAFTKDVVYLHGMMEVHTFFRWTLLHERLGLIHNFLAGRMTIDDAVRLGPYFDDGTLAGPRYLPPWLTRIDGLAGYLAFSIFANKISIDALEEGHSFDTVEDLHE